MVYFKQLGGEEARKVDPEQVPWPDDSTVVYGYEADQLVARSGLVLMPLIEGTWVVPEKRAGRLAIRLMAQMEELLRQAQKPYALALGADDQPEVGRYLQYLGYERVPVTLYKKALNKEPT